MRCHTFYFSIIGNDLGSRSNPTIKIMCNKRESFLSCAPRGAPLDLRGGGWAVFLCRIFFGGR